jgi:hypothetical protein
MKLESRPLEREEMAKITATIEELDREVHRGLNVPLIIGLGAVTLGSAIHIYHYDASDWSLISKSLICLCLIIIWLIIEEKYKGRKNRIAGLEALKSMGRSGVVRVCRIQAKRVIAFEEKEDEGVLYLIECDTGKCIYLWDEQYLIPTDGPFPSETIEVYLDDTFKYAVEEKVNCKGKRVDTITVSGKEKWEYFGHRGFPEDFEMEEKGFDEMLKALASPIQNIPLNKG